MTIKEIWYKAFDLYVDDDEKRRGHGKAWEFFCDCVAAGEITMNDAKELYNDMKQDRIDMYGLEPKTFKEELAQPEMVRRTRNCKVTIVNRCELIIRLAYQIQRDAKRVPEEDDEEHTKLVEEYTNRITRALSVLESAESLRYS